ncbi:hypothetical protein Syncc8109_1742 [Synechococcus sp. WH 8109]|nr:hypothetical protein Syncc8109_1742 [Synechococcus sp. WH 8109]
MWKDSETTREEAQRFNEAVKS